MSFAPLVWLLSTLTIWHFIGWLALTMIVVTLLTRGPSDGLKPKVTSIAVLQLQIVVLYSIMALIVGQSFGDCYSWSQLWPTGALLGVALGSMALLVHFPSREESNAKPRQIAVFRGCAAVFFACAFGLFFSGALYLLPKTVWLLFEFDRASWAVQL